MAISTKNNQIILKNGKHFYENSHEIESYFPSKFPYERLVISGKEITSILIPMDSVVQKLI